MAGGRRESNGFVSEYADFFPGPIIFYLPVLVTGSVSSSIK